MSTNIRQEQARHQGAGVAADLPVEGRLPSFNGATTWLNSSPLTPAGLHGQVVLVQFWTYTCINWLRTHPFVRAWAKRYKDKKLVVIGVHTPEFVFEHDLNNVQRAARAMGVDWPIAVDNDYEVWRAFSNHYWPALYFVDAEGRIRHHRFGEGDRAIGNGHQAAPGRRASWCAARRTGCYRCGRGGGGRRLGR